MYDLSETGYNILLYSTWTRDGAHHSIPEFDHMQQNSLSHPLCSASISPKSTLWGSRMDIPSVRGIRYPRRPQWASKNESLTYARSAFNKREWTISMKYWAKFRPRTESNFKPSGEVENEEVEILLSWHATMNLSNYDMTFFDSYHLSLLHFSFHFQTKSR